MARTTIKELEARMDKMDKRIDDIGNDIKSLLEAINGKPSKGKSSNGTKKTSKKTSETKSATKCEVTIEDGQGRGQGKKFIKIIFDGKPTDKTLKSLKDNGFKYFAPSKSWSTLHTDAKMKFAESLNK